MGFGILLQYSHHHLAKNIVLVLRKNTSSLAFESFRRGWCSPSTHPLVRQHRDLPGVREFLPCWKDQIGPNHGWNRRKPIFLEGCLKFVLSPLPSRIQILLLKWSFDLDMFMLYLYHQISKKRLWKTLERKIPTKKLGSFRSLWQFQVVCCRSFGYALFLGVQHSKRHAWDFSLRCLQWTWTKSDQHVCMAQ